MIKKIEKEGEFKPFPVYSERLAWDLLPENIKDHYISEAQKLINTEWLCLPASLYLEFYRDGSRNRYQEQYFKRRKKLFTLMMAECITGSGEYLDSIIDGVWLIAEESTWVIPAHINYTPDLPAGLPAGRTVMELPYPDSIPYIDLFAAETASLFSWIYYFLGDAIASRTPAVIQRMEREMERRIFLPFLQHGNYQWMNKPLNNWNPWINSNLLVAFLVFARVFPMSLEGVNKTVSSINRFIDSYAEDGGCDEGPHYFNKAAGSLLDFIEELGHITDVSYLYRIPKIKNMAAYIYKAYIAGNYFVNYSDSSPEAHVPVRLLCRTGEKTGDTMLYRFAAWIAQNNASRDERMPEKAYSVYRVLADIFSPPLPQTPAAEDAVLNVPPVNWFSGIQVVTARDYGSSAKGFFFSAKGGHNGESHNHNDIGNFILYCDGMPVLIDAGVETYTKITFNDQRYSLWAMQSCYHNTPTINGEDQLPGAEYRAMNVYFSHENGAVYFSMDLAKAYPAPAGITMYRREFTFQRGVKLAVTDSYLLDECKAPLVINLLCCDFPQASADGLLLSGKVLLGFDTTALAWAVEDIPLHDPKIKADWRKSILYRLRLTVKKTETSGKVHLRFSIPKPPESA